MTQAFSADPYAMVYEGRVYMYMTADKHMYEADGSLKKNNYSNINTLHVISSDDMVNWTDHGEILAAGKEGAANWGGNSWAPAACWKMIDGKAKFFLYFANSGNGIAVLTADSPVGPFVDPLGEAIVSRRTPTCAEVSWLFDPAVLIDDDGCGYLYFGGGIPCDEMIPNPGTARVAKLAEDMIHLDGDPKPIENVLYLFEDSGINKIGDKYIYSYCSNFNVPESGCEGYGFEKGEIVIMVGDNPMGPFSTVGGILKNPEDFFEYGGNNHHCMFEFEGKWYVAYHASLIEEKTGANFGYRSVNIDEISVNDKGVFAVATGTKKGVAQIKKVIPRNPHLFTTMANQAGIDVVPTSKPGTMMAVATESGSFIQVDGVDFGEEANAPSSLKITLRTSTPGRVVLRAGSPDAEDLGVVEIGGKQDAPFGTEEEDESKLLTEYSMKLTKKIAGVQDLFFVFEGENIRLGLWRFV